MVGVQNEKTEISQKIIAEIGMFSLQSTINTRLQLFMPITFPDEKIAFSSIWLKKQVHRFIRRRPA